MTTTNSIIIGENNTEKELRMVLRQMKKDFFRMTSMYGHDFITAAHFNGFHLSLRFAPHRAMIYFSFGEIGTADVKRKLYKEMSSVYADVADILLIDKNETA